MKPFTPQTVLQAYRQGLFPMAESADSPDIFWVEPQLRGIIPLKELNISTSLAKALRSDKFQIKMDYDFERVIAACAAPRFGQSETWINTSIREVYKELFLAGYCHSLEVYQESTLVGGLYGLAIGGAFFGESMFHLKPNASKIALVHLVAQLVQAGYSLLDTQFITSHLQSMGAIEITQFEYKKLLKPALKTEPKLFSPLTGREALMILEAHHAA